MTGGGDLAGRHCDRCKGLLVVSVECGCGGVIGGNCDACGGDGVREVECPCVRCSCVGGCDRCGGASGEPVELAPDAGATGEEEEEDDGCF